MSSSDIAISVRGLGKSYAIRHSRSDATTLAEAVVDRMRHPFRRGDQETFWALKDVTFDVKHGEVVGIIGRNGAGKSTLLKILSRITDMTEGEVDLYGRVGSLLEVGTGFHQDLSGRENIFLNGSILGMTRAEIRKQFDAIVDFAGVEKFLDTPVKRYSSGMYVRLAFAVAAHLRSEIMVVDEVLAVGDAEFQRKCLGKMKDVASSGRTVLFVSHNMHAVRGLCTDALLLKAGQLVMHANAAEVIAEYESATKEAAQSDAADAPRRGSGEYRFTHVRPLKAQFSCDEEKTFSFHLERRHGHTGGFFIGAHVVDSNGLLLLQFDSRMTGDWLEDRSACEGVLRFRSPWLKPGDYRIDMYIGAGGYVDFFEHACSFAVSGALPYERVAGEDATARGIVFGEFDYQISSSAPARPAPLADQSLAER